MKAAAKSIEQRLAEELDRKDAELQEMKQELFTARERLLGSASAWSLPRTVDDDEALPVPRLEVEWKPHTEHGWNHYTVEYRLVRRHLTGNLLVVPLGRTVVHQGASGDPRLQGPERALPLLMGPDAHHDAAHLALPLFVLLAEGPVRLDTTDGFEHQRAVGGRHRRSAPQ